MKLIGKLKENVEKAENKEQAKKIIKKAGMELTDEEMAAVSGGEVLCVRSGDGTMLTYEGNLPRQENPDPYLKLNPGPCPVPDLPPDIDLQISRKILHP